MKRSSTKNHRSLLDLSGVDAGEEQEKHSRYPKKVVWAAKKWIFDRRGKLSLGCCAIGHERKENKPKIKRTKRKKPKKGDGARSVGQEGPRSKKLTVSFTVSRACIVKHDKFTVFSAAWGRKYRKFRNYDTPNPPYCLAACSLFQKYLSGWGRILRNPYWLQNRSLSVYKSIRNRSTIDQRIGSKSFRNQLKQVSRSNRQRMN